MDEPEPISNQWSGQLTWDTTGGDKRLSIVVAPFLKRSTMTRRYAALAVEAPRTAETLGEIFANHGHADIGEFSTIAEAVAAAEVFIAKWIAGHPEVPPCECVDIAQAVQAAVAAADPPRDIDTPT